MFSRRWATCHLTRILIPLTLGLLACGSVEAPQEGDAHAIPARRGIQLRGAGASFPQAICSRWVFQYFHETGTSIRYEQVGSVQGLEDIKAGRVDFAVSDIPLSPEELEEQALVQFPLVLGALVPVVHLPGIGPGDLTLSADAVGALFTGAIRRWNHPGLRSLNPSLELPDKDVVVVYRADPSGTTWNFTRHLERVSADWTAGVGFAGSSLFSVGVGAQGKEQVARFVGQFKYTISYEESSFAKQNGLAWVRLLDRNGVVTAPTDVAVAAAAEQGMWLEGNQLDMLGFDAPCWPITVASYALMKREQRNSRKTRALLDFFHWTATDGRHLAQGAGFTPVPERYVPLIERAWSQTISANGQPLWNTREPVAAGNLPPLPPEPPLAGAEDGATIR